MSVLQDFLIYEITSVHIFIIEDEGYNGKYFLLGRGYDAAGQHFLHFSPLTQVFLFLFVFLIAIILVFRPLLNAPVRHLA